MTKKELNQITKEIGFKSFKTIKPKSSFKKVKPEIVDEKTFVNNLVNEMGVEDADFVLSWIYGEPLI